MRTLAIHPDSLTDSQALDVAETFEGLELSEEGCRQYRHLRDKFGPIVFDHQKEVAEEKVMWMRRANLAICLVFCASFVSGIQNMQVDEDEQTKLRNAKMRQVKLPKLGRIRFRQDTVRFAFTR